LQIQNPSNIEHTNEFPLLVFFSTSIIHCPTVEPTLILREHHNWKDIARLEERQTERETRIKIKMGQVGARVTALVFTGVDTILFLYH
jgi:hypothetical protein